MTGSPRERGGGPEESSWREGTEELTFGQRKCPGARVEVRGRGGTPDLHACSWPSTATGCGGGEEESHCLSHLYHE